MAYNPNIPNPSDFLSDSQVDIKANFSALNTVYSIDHTAFTGVTNAGFHKPVHIVAAAIPTAVSGTNIVSSASVTPNTLPGSAADVQLFSRTAGGVISQLTGHISEAEGYQWLGGILVQWGTVAMNTGVGTNTHRTGPVSFQARNAGKTIPFPNQIFGVNASLIVINTTTTDGENTIATQVPTINGFTWVYNGNSAGIAIYPDFFWIAIGR